MRRFEIVLLVASLLGVNGAAAQQTPIKCELMRNVADTQAASTRAVATETKATAQGGLAVDNEEAQAALERLQEAARRAEASVNALAEAWEEYQIATIRCAR